MSIITQPFRSPNHSKQLHNNSSFYETDQFDNHDFTDIVQLANFIGLSPVNRVKRRTSSKIQTFLKTNNLSFDSQQRVNSHKIIKNDITNRQINFFDLQKILQQKKKHHIFQKSNPNTTKNRLKNQQSTEKRAHSQRHFKCFSPFQMRDIQTQTTKRSEVKRLEIQTARQLSRKQKQRTQRYIQIEQHLRKMHKSLLNRSKILKQTFQSSISQNIENPSLLMNSKLHISKFKFCKKL